MRAPDDVAIIGFDGVPIAQYVTPALSTMALNLAELGERAVERLIAATENPDARADHRNDDAAPRRARVEPPCLIAGKCCWAARRRCPRCAMPALECSARHAPADLIGDVQRRTFALLLGPRQPGQRTDARPLAEPELLEHRRDRLRADRLSDRGRARLDHASAGARADAGDVALLLERAAGADARAGVSGLQGLLLPLPRHADRAALPPVRTVVDRHRAAARRRAVRRAIFRPARRGRDPRPRAAHLCAVRLALVPASRRGEARVDGLASRRAGSSSGRGSAIPRGRLLYILALGAPDFALGRDAYDGWCSTYGDSWRGEGDDRFLAFGPHFAHQFTQCWVDLRGMRDAPMRAAGFDYFENSRRATIAQRDYAIANPGGWTGYSRRHLGTVRVRRPGGRHDRRPRNSTAMRRAARSASPTDSTTARSHRWQRWPRCRSRPSWSSRRRARSTIATAARSTANTASSTAFNPSFTSRDVPLAARARDRHGRVGRQRLSGDRPGPDRGDDREPSQRAGVGAHARRCRR